MAKLSAHGYEVARLVIFDDAPAPRWDGDTTTAREIHLSFRSDGHILRRDDTIGLVYPGERHSAGWKLYKRYSDRKITPDRIREHASRIAARHEERGDRVERRGC